MNKKYQKVQKLIEKYVNHQTIIRNCKGDSEMIAIYNKIVERQKNKNEISVRNWLHSMLREKLYEIAKNLPSTGYSMGENKKAVCGKHIELYQNTYTYSGHFKGSETHGYVEFKTSYKDIRNIKVVGGLITYIYPNQKSKVKRCYWIESSGRKNNFYTYKQEGYIYNDYHHVDKKTAYKKGRENELYQQKKERIEKNYQKALRKQYSYQDSIDAGNCEAGTRAFIMRMGLDINKKYRGKYLLELTKEKSYSSVRFVEKMIENKC